MENSLTKEWSKYYGDYSKQMQDIKLRNGDIITMCWPNAGKWTSCEKQQLAKYEGEQIDNSEVVQVRLTHSKNW